jgi:hypothetical protein
MVAVPSVSLPLARNAGFGWRRECAERRAENRGKSTLSAAAAHSTHSSRYGLTSSPVSAARNGFSRTAPALSTNAQVLQAGRARHLGGPEPLRRPVEGAGQSSGEQRIQVSRCRVPHRPVQVGRLETQPHQGDLHRRELVRLSRTVQPSGAPRLGCRMGARHRSRSLLCAVVGADHLGRGEEERRGPGHLQVAPLESVALLRGCGRPHASPDPVSHADALWLRLSSLFEHGAEPSRVEAHSGTRCSRVVDAVHEQGRRKLAGKRAEREAAPYRSGLAKSGLALHPSV